MDLKGIIAQHAEPIARAYGTTWDDVLRECGRNPKAGRPYSKATVNTLMQVYNLSILTGPEVLKQLYGFRVMPQRVEERATVRKKTKVW